MPTIVFCPECRQDIEFNTKEKQTTTTVVNKTVTFTETIAYCNNCHSEIWVPELEDQNLKKFVAVFKNQ